MYEKRLILAVFLITCVGYQPVIPKIKGLEPIL